MMGEFRHEVLVDGKTETLPVMGCDLEAVPQAHGDLRKNDSAVHNTDDYRFAELALAEARKSEPEDSNHIRGLVRSLSAGATWWLLLIVEK
jgi:hypothetical protein